MSNNKKVIVKTACKECGFPITVSLYPGEEIELKCPICKEKIKIRSTDGRR
jgi:uncharacterized Zn finger protein (UPF0148 family)